MGKKEELTETQKVAKLLSISGHGLHLRVADLLSKQKPKKWDISVSAYYVDSVTDKARETDIIATMQYPSQARIDSYTGWKFLLRLGIECKYLTEPLVFWTGAHQMNPRAASIIGWEIEELKQAGLCATHHYFATEQKVAYLNAVYNDQRGDEKKFSDAIVSTIQGLSFKMAASEKSLNYPVIVVGGAGMYLQDGTEVKRVLYHVDYAYRDPKNEKIKEKRFYVDIIREEVLPQLLVQIDKAANWMMGIEEFAVKMRHNNANPPRVHPGR